ncbi:hypothetical protein M9H77_14777 [Catharanthus roseus]|uniref:Uncharacterized protein n=1 Tax=Catharanthus roseus TaxID=4058 RepID=A0ACC0BP99_CATRO|nr:hypothetical protein M9H77_14777 [Catharanthus roseus]
MPRPSVSIVFVLMILLNSWIELKYNMNKVEAFTTALRYKSSSDLPESLKDKSLQFVLSSTRKVSPAYHPSTESKSFVDRIILSQEKSIQELNQLVQDLRKKLELCKAKDRIGAQPELRAIMLYS